ncbi:MAG: response regulator transcription factor [Myxococcota bacterium]
MEGRAPDCPTILIVDDDQDVLDSLSLLLEAKSFDVATAHHGERALELHGSSPADVIISDVNMPFLDGFALCRYLREQADPVPIVLLTSRDSEIDEVLGLDLGADDYIAKPYSPRVLLARISTLLRRKRRAKTSEPQVLEQDGLLLDLDAMRAHFLGRPLELTVTEVKLLEALMRRPGNVLSRNRLMELSRGEDAGVVASRIIDTYVARIRRKLRAIDDSADLVETVVGAGYRFRTGA